MDHPEKMNPTTDEATAPSAASTETAADAAAAATAGSSDATQALPETDPLADMTVEMEKWKDTALRTAAELDNYRKRAARDMQDARSYANADLLRTLIPILDTFEMGLEAARAESETSIVFQGLSMVRGMFQNFLKEQGVDEIVALGQKFDPNLHEAMSTEAHAEAPEGSVIRVLRRGFKLKDRLLRAAAVVVSSGAAKDEAAA